MKKGKLIIISGPSGAGKSTVINKMMQMRDDVCFSISATTRKPRPGEENGREYFFVEPNEFELMVKEDKLLEHAEFVANKYGTPKEYVNSKIEEGLNVILDIEVQGAKQVYDKVTDCIKIFIVPPSLDELRNRLEARNTETQRAIEARLIRAKQEYSEANFYDYIIINSNAEEAAKKLDAVITASHCLFKDNSYILLGE